MVLTLKAVWTSDSGESEIRRVTVNEDTINQYNLLAEKIVRLFPQLAVQCFQLGWKDSEGDYIVMSSDEELAQAIANIVENGLIKIYVTTKTLKSTDQKPKSSVAHHPHVICDGCNGNVVGYRYKCLECMDYDLCEGCHRDDKHPGHDMLKICTPVGQAHNWMFPGWRRMYRSMFGQHPFGKHCGRKAESTKHGEETDKKGRPGSATSNRHTEFLKNIGKSVAFFLDPLGIDVDVMVSESEGDSSSSSGSKKEAESQPAAEESEPKNVAEEDVKPDEDNKNEADVRSDISEVTNEQSANAAAASQNEDSAAESCQGARPKNYGLFQRSDSCEANGDSREQSPDFNGHDGWTVVNDVPTAKDEQNDTVVKPSAPSEKVSYPELPDEKMPYDVGAQSAAVPAHPDPKISNALVKMCAMGFTNEGGWLVRLLETKNGNINDVLDALYPNRH